MDLSRTTLFGRYTNKVSVEVRVYKNLKLFMENKNDADELFDRLTVGRCSINESNRDLIFSFEDIGLEPILERADGRTDGESLSHVQRFEDPSRSARSADRVESERVRESARLQPC